MSQATKRKYVTNEVLNEFVLPNENQTIVKIIATKGNNLHMVMSSDKNTFLVSMPPKFRKNVWIKRGDYVIVEPIAEGDRVKGEIVAILYRDQIRHIRTHGQWPFVVDGGDETPNKGGNAIPNDMLPPSGSDDSDAENRQAGVDTNRPHIAARDGDSGTDSDCDDGE